MLFAIYLGEKKCMDMQAVTILFVKVCLFMQMRVLEEGTEEASFAKVALFSRHPEMEGIKLLYMVSLFFFISSWSTLVK